MTPVSVIHMKQKQHTCRSQILCIPGTHKLVGKSRGQPEPTIVALTNFSCFTQDQLQEEDKKQQVAITWSLTVIGVGEGVTKGLQPPS